jgi:hypothetical protein
VQVQAPDSAFEHANAAGLARFMLGTTRRLVVVSDAGSAEMNSLAVAKLTLADTNTADYTVCRLAEPMSFAL